jgi:hypothetical protein
VRGASSILGLQRAVGNHAVQHLLNPGAPVATVQAKLAIGSANDIYEHEADSIAERVMRMPDARVQRKCSCAQGGGSCRGCAEDEARRERPPQLPTPLSIQRQAALSTTIGPDGSQAESSATPAHAARSVTERINSLRGAGRSLPEDVQDFFEPRFGARFDHVRVHAHDDAADLAQSLNARAFTVGRDLFFGQGQYAPDTASGKRLLAHELTHVIQQDGPMPTTQQTANSVSPTIGVGARVMREGFESTISICRRVLESRKFKVRNGGVRIVLLLDPLDKEIPNCDDFTFGVTLTKSEDWWPDDDIGSCEAKTGGMRSFSFANLSNGTYYFMVWRTYDHPYCCLTGDVLVFDEAVAADSSGCTRDKDPSVMDIVHGALDIAGFIPVLGAVPDGINAVIYAAEGDWVNAGVSAVAMVPAFGDGAKLSYKTGKYVVEASGKTVVKMGEEQLARNLKQVAAERTAKQATEVAPRAPTGRVDPDIDVMVERGIVEEAESTTRPVRRPRPGRPATTGLGEAARKEFDRVRDGYASRLGVASGGQVHHAIELQALDRYPGVFTASELNNFANMRGIGTEVAGRRQLHNSKIREVWDRHYRRIDGEISSRGLQPGTQAYNDFVRRNMEEARNELDHVLGQFFTEYRTGRPRSFK